jgi:hypothetical protein
LVGFGASVARSARVVARVAFGPTVAGVHRGALVGGVLAAATDEDEAVESSHHPPVPVGQLGRVGGDPDSPFGRGREEQHLTAGRLDHVDVETGHEGSITLPRPPRGGLPVGGYPDEGPWTDSRHAGQYPTASQHPGKVRLEGAPRFRTPDRSVLGDPHDDGPAGP